MVVLVIFVVIVIVIVFIGNFWLIFVLFLFRVCVYE